jgi:SlyX protein
VSDENSKLSRLNALETLLAHQERTIAELNEAITAQWRKIDVLERQVAKLLDEVRNVTTPRDGSEPPPPHY